MTRAKYAVVTYSIAFATIHDPRIRARARSGRMMRSLYACYDLNEHEWYGFLVLEAKCMTWIIDRDVGRWPDFHTVLADFKAKDVIWFDQVENVY